MSTRQFKSQASSGRAGGTFGGFGGSGFGSKQSSTLSYIQEPPDYSHVGDANVVVAFKNLSKKDGTTKAKALEDLLAYVTSPDVEIEDAVLEAWVKLYPRLSIDSTRRVRQLSHNLNGQICLRCGKRTARYMPRIAGPWLAGGHDNDRTAAKAAQEALNLVFSNAEKVHVVRMVFQAAILDYCRDAILVESQQTMSDERTVSPDDAEATYARVAATSLAVIANLLDDLSGSESGKQRHVYEGILSDSKLWAFVSHPDAGVRRSMHRFVRLCIGKLPEVLESNLESISAAYVYKGLPSEQSGSALDFVQTLDALTADYSTIWTTSYSGKKSALSRLRQLLKHGSYSGSADFWPALENLVRKVPAEVLPHSYDEVAELLTAMHDGITRREERFAQSTAWQTYFTLINTASASLSGEERVTMIESHLMPLFRQYLHPSRDLAKWTVRGPRAPRILSKATPIAGVTAHLEREWPSFTGSLIEAIRLSQPEQSKDFDKSQREVAAWGERWCALQRELFASVQSDALREVIVSQDLHLLKESFSLLESRHGKPYGAAATMDELLRVCGQYVMDNVDIRFAVTYFAQHTLPSLLFSPSQRYLAHCLYALSSEAAFEAAFAATLKHVLNEEGSSAVRSQALRTLFTAQTPEKARTAAQDSAGIQNLLLELTTHGHDESEVGLFADLSKAGVLTPETTHRILGTWTISLSSLPHAGRALEELHYLNGINPGLLREFVVTSGYNSEELLPNVLRLEQSPDDKVAELATKLSAKLSIAPSDTAQVDRLAVLRTNLEKPPQTSLRLASLHDLTSRLLGQGHHVGNPAKVLPDFSIWRTSLLEIMVRPRPSLAITSALGGGVHMVRSDGTERVAVPTDREGFCQPLRMAMYVSRLLATTDLAECLGDNVDETSWSHPGLVALLILTILLAEDNLSVPGTNSLWRNEAENEIEVLDFITEANSYLLRFTEVTPPDRLQPFQEELDRLRGKGEENESPIAYYCALASERMYANIFETHGSNSEQSKASEDILRRTTKSDDTLAALAHIVGFQQPLTGTQALSRVCNELVADLTGADIEKSQQEAVTSLVTLNTILQTQEDAVAFIAKQRLVFLVKHIITWLNTTIDPTFTAEVCKALSLLLPGMQDMYGEHWAKVLSFVSSCWNDLGSSQRSDIDEERILVKHASLRLHGVLHKLTKLDEINDDLLDAFKGARDALAVGLIKLLKASARIPDEAHKPLMITNELLALQLSQAPPRIIDQIGEIYALLYAPSHAIQQAAFGLLHEQIPAAQEQISFEAALDKKTAQLPDELLSLLLGAPTLDSLVDASFVRSMPLSLQGYLYSWRSLFDHFNGSSYKVKSDYIEQLKEGTYLPSLLGLAFDFLGHSRGKPADASKFDVANYQADMEPSPERDVRWLLTHLYYLALTHVPSLTKSYYLDIRSRQTSLAVESWTAKYISPLVMNASLQSVSEWSEKSVKEDPDYEKMSVKVSMRSKEINVSYIVDEQLMAIKVVLPDAYPLAAAKVIGVSRVAVKEEKWQSWLRNCQGVITFSNGSIIDGLSAWRKNVVGALRGSTECSICYSLVSSDKQLPEKRCGTCSNKFHASCLYKWFKTSNASTCPLCRTGFNFN